MLSEELVGGAGPEPLADLPDNDVDVDSDADANGEVVLDDSLRKGLNRTVAGVGGSPTNLIWPFGAREGRAPLGKS